MTLSLSAQVFYLVRDFLRGVRVNKYKGCGSYTFALERNDLDFIFNGGI